MNKIWIVIVVIVIAAGVWWMKGGSVPGVPSFTTTASPSSAAQASKTPSAVVKKTATPAPTQSATYSQLVQQFGDNRIQFDSSCQAQPKSMVVKNGTQILLDNRSDQVRTVVVNGNSYTLGGYGYQVVTLSTSSVPTTLRLSCNNLVNVGTVRLEANISGQ